MVYKRRCRGGRLTNLGPTDEGPDTLATSSSAFVFGNVVMDGALMVCAQLVMIAIIAL